MTAKQPTPTHVRPPDDDLDAEPTAEELAGAAALRQALEGGDEQPDADFARALRAAHGPGDLDAAAHERILARALGPGRPQLAAPLAPPAEPARPEGARLLAFRRVPLGAFGLVAAAAAAALVFGGARAARPGATAAMEPGSAPIAAAAQPLLLSRSTQDLFPEPFPRGERASRRVDRIAMARARDLRENRFSQWGVR